jgi:hypothetical protein
MTVFAALPLLQHMIINQVDPTVAFSELGRPSYTFKVATLKKLDIGNVKRKGDGDESDFAKFLGAFYTPELHSLIIRDISGEQWKHLVTRFAESVEKYPALDSLTITDLHDISNTSPDPSLAFPNLQNLNLIRSSTDFILKHLFVDSTSSTGITSWPKFRNLIISDDPDISPQLLHRIVKSRQSRTFTLFLNGRKYNLETWNRQKEKAEVVPMR